MEHATLRRSWLAAAAAAGLLIALARAPHAAAHERYVVRLGDTLSAIAAAYGTTPHEVAHANGFAVGDVLYTGRALMIPTGGTASASTSGQVPRLITEWAERYGVDARLARALAWMESGYQPGVVSAAGASGVMQLMPDAWRFVEDVIIGTRVGHTTDGNIQVGVAYLHHLLHVFNGDQRLALAAYYQGAWSVQAHGLLPITEQYVADVIALTGRV